ncbi:hypothetical protein [Noviherbaspirillum sp. Root189]|uniref:hypothetical protein n=1 Tax=Noviherbaspirillum sp. Root189 TaxID=1736487 RepID=UPI00070B372E|nr:hypothetical protein [Noviherbaspirillum sp. Root189]KRB83875.1 hypothetical protein ASE07_23430 [Noviherbaspirillum sp. Root189]
MTTITIGSSSSYTENVVRTARDLFVALFALNKPKAATKKRSAPINLSLSDAYADVFNLPRKSLIAASEARSRRGSALVPYAHWSAAWHHDKN